MREIWIPVWFATALSAIVLVAGLVSHTWQAATTAFFCFLPIVFVHVARNTERLAKRVEELERLARERNG